MKLIHRLPLFVSLMGAALFTCAAAAQQVDRRNAATWYEQAFDMMGRLTVDEFNAVVMTLREPAGPTPTPELRRALAKAAPIIARYQRGAGQVHSDFGVDHSQGVELMLPHLTQVRQLARLTAVDALVRLQDGDPVTGANRLANMYRSSTHLGGDDVVISTLVGQAIFSLTDTAVQHAIDRGVLDSAGAGIVLRELERLGEGKDPFNYVGAAFGERELIVNWLSGEIEKPDAAERISAMFDAVGDVHLEGFGEKIASLSREEFDFAVTQYDAMTERAAEVLTMDDPDAARAAMAELMQEVRDGAFGPIASQSVSWDRLLDRKITGEEMLEKRLEVLRELAAGEVQPEDLANAAVWYLRAFQMIEALDSEQLSLLRQFITAEDVEPEDGRHTPGRALEPVVLLARDIIEVLRDAASLRRCDFSIANVSRGIIAPPYASSMRDSLRLVHADSLRLIRGRRIDDAAERLSMGYRMIGHFSGDPYLVCSILSHRAFLEAAELLALLINDDRLGEDERDSVFAAVESIDVDDAFGYMAAHRRTLEELRTTAARYDELAERAMAQAVSESPELARAVELAEAAAPMPTNVEIINRASVDAILFYAATLRYFYRPHEESFDEEQAAEAEAEERQRWSALWDVIDLDALMATRAEAPLTVGQRWRDRRRGMLHGLEVRTLNALAGRHARARADLRTTADLLRPAARLNTDARE